MFQSQAWASLSDAAAKLCAATLTWMAVALALIMLVASALDDSSANQLSTVAEVRPQVWHPAVPAGRLLEQH